MAEVLQVEFSGVLCQIDGVYILERKRLIKASVKQTKHLLTLNESYRNKQLHKADETSSRERYSQDKKEQEHEKDVEKYKDMRERGNIFTYY